MDTKKIYLYIYLISQKSIKTKITMENTAKNVFNVAVVKIGLLWSKCLLHRIWWYLILKCFSQSCTWEKKYKLINIFCDSVSDKS